jgi:hypothetical protein
MKSRGTARPTFAAPAPFSAIAAVGAMMPIESAIVSGQTHGESHFGCLASHLHDRLGQEHPHHPVRDVDHLVDPQVAGDRAELRSSPYRGPRWPIMARVASRAASRVKTAPMSHGAIGLRTSQVTPAT